MKSGPMRDYLDSRTDGAPLMRGFSPPPTPASRGQPRLHGHTPHSVDPLCRRGRGREIIGFLARELLAEPTFRDNVFYHEMTKKPPKRLGRPPIGREAMSPAERQRRRRAKVKPRRTRMSPKPRPGDRALAERLEGLRRAFEAGGDFPDVVAVWEAIERITANNRKLLKQGEAAGPFPEWVNDYLHRSADKIGRLWLGIRPEDDRPMADIGFDEVGELKQVRQGGRLRDDRISHVAAALGFARRGVTAFQRHDRTTRDADYIKIYDDPDLQIEGRRAVVSQMKKTEHINTDQAVRNRLSKARRAAQRSKS
jgi:hypothetical protein